MLPIDDHGAVRSTLDLSILSRNLHIRTGCHDPLGSGGRVIPSFGPRLTHL